MKTRILHRVTGLVMLLPLLAWAITGAIFFLKPGYAGAYESLPVKTYPLASGLAVQPDPAWLEVRVVKTILGEHLLARTAEGWQQIDLRNGTGPGNLQVRPAPSDQQLRVLLVDAFSINPARYGQIVSVESNTATTDTGVQVTLDWNRLTLAQRGKDTDRIDFFYRLHYLQWTGVAALDKVLGAAGITLVVALSLLGARLFFRRG